MMRFTILLLMLLAMGCQNQENESVAKAQSGGSDIDAKLESLGIQLPEAATPVANYVNAVRTGRIQEAVVV